MATIADRAVLVAVMSMEGFTRYVLSGCQLFGDDNIPEHDTVSYYQTLIVRSDTILLFRSTPVFYCYPETYSNTLDAALGTRVYTACIPRWPEAVAVLTGAFYNASQFA